MINRTSAPISAALIGALLALASAANAKPQPVDMVQTDAPMRCHADLSKPPKHAQAQHAKHIAKLQAKLQLTPAQQPAFDAYTASMQSMHDSHMPAKPRAKCNPNNITAPQIVQNKLAHIEQAKSALTQQQAALTALYSQLSPEQKLVMDQHIAHAMQPPKNMGKPNMARPTKKPHHQHNPQQMPMGENMQPTPPSNTSVTPPPM